MEGEHEHILDGPSAEAEAPAEIENVDDDCVCVGESSYADLSVEELQKRVEATRAKLKSVKFLGGIYTCRISLNPL